MPNASAPKAPCVAVWLSPQTMVMPGWCIPFRANDMHDSLMDIVQIVEPYPKLFAIVTERVDLLAEIGSAIGKLRLLSERMVRSSDRAFRPSDFCDWRF